MLMKQIAINKRKLSTTTIVAFILMCLLTAMFLYPLWFMLMNAMKTKQEYYVSQFALPGVLNFDQFRTVINNFNIFNYFGSTFIITITSTVLLVALALFASYAFAKLKFRWKKGVYFAIIATMFLPGQVSMIPAYVMFSKFGLIDNYWSVILTYIASGLPAAILLINSAVLAIPNEMVESGRIDGAGYFKTVLHVIFPLSLSGIAIVVIFNFIGYWNDLITPLLYLESRTKQTVMVALIGLVQRTSSQPTVQLAGLILSVVPVVAIYLFLQRFIIKGMMVGSFR